jgi:hypothetical protein
MTSFFILQLTQLAPPSRQVRKMITAGMLCYTGGSSDAEILRGDDGTSPIYWTARHGMRRDE